MSLACVITNGEYFRKIVWEGDKNFTVKIWNSRTNSAHRWFVTGDQVFAGIPELMDFLKTKGWRRP